MARAATRAVVTTAAVVGTAAAVAGASSRQAARHTGGGTTTIIVTNGSGPQAANPAKQQQRSASSGAQQPSPAVPAYQPPKLPDLSRISRDLASLEDMQTRNDVLVARDALPTFKRFYLEEREKYTDLQALHQTDIRLMVVENWLKRAHGLPEWPLPNVAA